MAINLPDIDEQSYQDYQSEQLRQEIEKKQQSFSLQNAINEKIAGLQSIVGGATSALGGAIGSSAPAPAPPAEPVPAPPPEPAPSTPAPEPEPTPAPLPDVFASQAQAPEPAPAPSAESAPETAPVPSPVAAAPTASAGPLPSTVSAPPTPAPTTGGGLQDWITSAMGAAARSGADLQAFANNFSTSGDLVGNALGAALKAGADPQAFMSGLTAPPTQTAPSGAANRVTGAAPGGDLVDYARGAAQRAGIDPDIFVRQIQQESGFNPNAKSGAGAIGIAQFMPGTAAGMKVDPTDPYAALDAAAQMNAQNLQRYGGDYSKMLAAYNAGGGAVDRYGGVPPFEETQRYVKNILGGVGEAVGKAVGGAATAVRGAANQISQFGNPQLTNDEAYAACGPAAAVRFASMYGRNPTLREATDLAKTVGWTPGSGMAGLGSEKSLMDKLGVATRMVLGGQWDVFAKEAQSGNPVTISTPGHYFFADGYDPQSGAFHVGRSGSDLRQGSEWMTPAQMEGVMGKVQGGLLADNPQVPSPSIATTSSSAAGTLGSAAQPDFQVDRPLTDVTGRLTSAATGRPDTSMGGLQAASVGEAQPLNQSPIDRLKSAFGDFIDSLQQQPAGQPAQSQAIPSDTLTNPLGNRYEQAPASAQLTGQPSAGIAPDQSAWGPALAQGVQEFATGTGEVGKYAPSSIMQGAETAVGNALQPGGALSQVPVLGGVSEMVRPTVGMNDQEILARHKPDEIASVRDMFGNLGTRVGGTVGAENVDDKLVADWFRSQDLAQAAAHTTPIGGPGDLRPRPGTRAVTEDLGPARPDRMSPRASAGDIPQTGSDMLASALQDLEGYPSATAAQIRDFAATADAPASQVASTIRRWMEDNPLATTLDKPPAVVGEQAVREMEANLRTGGGLRGGVGPEKGQLGLEIGGEPLAAVEPLLPEGTGAGFNPQMLLPDYVPKNELEARWIARTKANIEASRAARAARGETDLPTSGYYEPSLLGDRDVAVQGEMRPPGEGEFQTPSAEAFATSATPPLDLPHYLPKSIQALVQDAHQRGLGVETAPSDATWQTLADQVGTTPERLQSIWGKADQPGQTVRAFSRALDTSRQELERIQAQLKLTPNDATLRGEMIRQLAAHQGLQEAADARISRAGSLVESLKPGTVKGDQAVLDQIQQMAKRMNMDPDAFMQKLTQVDMSDPAVVSSLAKATRSFSTWDRAIAIYYFSLLSNPMTHIRNFVSNTATAFGGVPERAGAALFDPLARKALGDTGPRQRYAGEAGAMVQGMASGLGDAGRDALNALRYGAPSEGGEITRLAHEPFAGTPLAALGLPGRALEATDQGFRGINRAADLRAQAFRIAKQEGLSGDAFSERVANLLKAPTEEMTKAANDFAAYQVFQQSDEFASKLNAAVNAWPALKVVMPFTRTPINVMKYALERSPAGAAKLAYDYTFNRGALKAAGSGELADRMARTAIGSTIMGSLAAQATVFDNLTGRAPTDPVERDAFYRQGKIPYAFKNPVNGEWVSYAALQPYSALIGSAADVAQAIHSGKLDAKDAGGITTLGAVALAKGLTNVQWAQGLSDVLDLFTNGSQDPLKDAQKIAANTAASAATPGLIRAVAQMTDNVVRDPATDQFPERVKQTIMANVPGLSGQVAPKLDAFGFPVERPNEGLAAMINPFPMHAEANDLVENELARLQLKDYKVEPGLVGKNVNVLEKFPVTLTDEQQNYYQQQSGQLSYAMLASEIGTPAWDKMTDQQKAKRIDEITTKSREVARAAMTAELLPGAASEFEKQLTRRGISLPTPTPGTETEQEVGAGAGG